jgi:hypothetical protein
MLKKTVLLTLLSFFVSVQAYAAGGITHMFIAKEVIPHLSDRDLKNLIENNLDAYLVGSNYPDSGYMQGTHYGDATHWQKFIDTSVIYLHERYPYPEQQNPALVAFLLGCATHIVSDQVFHGAFINKVSKEDFHHHWQTAHTVSEEGLDMLVLLDKKQWQVRPVIWWLPLHDLVQIYQRMGKNNYSQSEIFWGNTLYSLTGIGQRALTPFGYNYIKLTMPWLSHHYEDTKEGGLLMTEQLTINYLQETWKKITVKVSTAETHPKLQVAPETSISPTFTFA